MGTRVVEKILEYFLESVPSAALDTGSTMKVGVDERLTYCMLYTATDCLRTAHFMPTG